MPLMRHKFLVLTVKKWLKPVYIYGSYRKIKTGVPLFWTTLYIHRPLKLRTDGGQSRVCELGSIDLFVVIVTSLKGNQLSPNNPNFEHKFPIMYGILTANFFAV